MVEVRRGGVTVVIVNWNAGEALAECLASVASEPGLAVVVVDNASTDGSTARAVAAHPRVRTIALPQNLGFAGGANTGAAVAEDDTLVFLNPDARVEPGAIGTLTEALHGRADAAIAGGSLRDEEGRWQPGSARFGVVGHLVLDTTVGRLRQRRASAPFVVDWVYGTFMAVRRRAFVELGGFDPAYFLYGEDLDLCHRAAAVGWRTLHVPGARAVHGRNLSATARFGVGRDAAVVAGEIRFYARRRGPAAAALYRALAAVKFGTKAALAAATGRASTAQRAARVLRVCLGESVGGAG